MQNIYKTQPLRLIRFVLALVFSLYLYFALHGCQNLLAVISQNFEYFHTKVNATNESLKKEREGKSLAIFKPWIKFIFLNEQFLNP